MAKRKTPPAAEEVIEGAAVEKKTPASKSASARKAAEDMHGPASGRNRSDSGQSDSFQSDPPSSGPSRSGGGKRVALITVAALAGLCVLVGGYLLVQSQARQSADLQRLDLIETQLVSLSDRIAAADSANAALRARQQDQQQALATMLADVTAAMPPDIVDQLNVIAGRLGVLETAETTDTGPLAVNGLSSELLLTQSGLNMLAAMLAENSAGLDLRGWMPALHALSDAGLALGDLDALGTAMAVMPPSRAQLLLAGWNLPETIGDASANVAPEDKDGWWSSLAGGLSNFVTLRRAGPATSSGSSSPGSSPAVLSAEQALQKALVAGQLAAAVAIVAAMPPDPQRDAWRQTAEARLLIDSRLAALTMRLTTKLARRLTPVEGQ
jgi:hypothetical protein